MSGGRHAVESGRELRDQVVQLAHNLGLQVQTEVRVGRRIYGKRRKIDIVLRKPNSEKILGVECKYQRTPGTAEEKIAIIIHDIDYWPIPGIVVIDGPGFSPEVKAYLLASGKVVEFDDLEAWLRLFFAL